MFHIFNKKRFLADYLENFVDIHNHILPGIDDGAKTAVDSLALIREFSELGIHKFVATPHIMHNFYDNTPTSIISSLHELKNELLKNDLRDVSIEASAEHMIDDNFEIILENDGIMPLRRSYLLIEMSYLQPSINFDEAVQQIATKRYFPIFAHPERYVYLHNNMKRYRDYKKQGILFQLNLLSLGEFYGTDVKKMALKLLNEGLIDFVASDVHNLNQLKHLKELSATNQLLKLVLPIIEKTIYNFY